VYDRRVTVPLFAPPRLSRKQSWQIKRVQFVSQWLLRLARVRLGARALVWLRSLPGGDRLLRRLVGYRAPFDTYDEAEAASDGLDNGGHANPMMASVHLNITAELRPSDYPALYHIHPLMPAIRRVFDVGGSIGNLYYAYLEYLTLPNQLVWEVYDLPAVVRAGQSMARERGGRHLAFTSDWRDANGADLLIASGSAHYLRTALPRMMADLEELPPYVLLNRTPLRRGRTIATNQDGLVRLPCALYAIEEIVSGFEKIGYQVIDQWKANEVSLHIPGFPDLSVPHYSGMFLRRKTAPALPH